MSVAVVAIGYGGPENLSLIEVPDREPGLGEVLLEVRAAGINPVDAKTYRGEFGTDPDRLPLRLGSEAAGVVAAVGPDAVGPAGPVRVGDEVIAFPVSGGYADRLVVPASAVVPKPAAMTFEEAAGLMLAGATAVHALSVLSLRPGQTVLVHGAAGGVGLMAVQLAVGRGVHVVGTAGRARHDLLRELGAEPVEYGPGLADRVRAVAPSGVDGAVDTAGTDEAIDVSLELVGDPQQVVTIASFGYGAQRGVIRIGGGPGADPGTQLRDAARLELVEQVDKGALRVLVAGTWPLADVAQAHRAITGSHAPGKLALVP
jgi:NADPH:quinone reductase-like Zn-dependent oxidoreductase